MAVETATTPGGQIADLGKQAKSRSLMSESMQRLFRNKAAVMGMFIIAVFTFVAIFAPFISPHDPLQFNSGKDFLPPAWVEKAQNGKSGDPNFLLGTDTLGRDVLSRVIYGARVSMVVGLIPTTIILIVGTLIGMIAGYAGGRTDNYLMRLTDVIYAFPDLLFFIIVMIALRDTVLGNALNGLFLLFIALAIVNWVGVARLVRGQTLSLKQKEFIEASRSIGVKASRIMSRHLLPNTLSVLIVSAAFTIPNLIIAEAILGYLGLGLRPATDSSSFFVTSWGSLLLEGQSAINAQPWMLLAPSICIALVVMAFTFLGDGLRDALDPRMRGTQ
jgi:ABC-type dipeptide/oligopeptide/nickel transport system permease subunit